MENGSENVQVNDAIKNVDVAEKKNINKRRKYGFFVKKFGCMRMEDDDSTTVEQSDGDGSFNVEAAGGGKDQPPPTHLIVMVNGIIGSAKNWRYAANQIVKAYPKDVIVHCSESNSNMLTFDGVDVMGKRLADEVVLVIRRHPNLRKISFISHSLGGLVARYAIARLYEKEAKKVSKEDGEYRVDGSNELCLEEESDEGKIAGLEPVNFITSATPHLGLRGHRQVPVFCGFYTLEKVARHTSWILGRTGKHLFLVDSDHGKPPLLLQMANDTEDLQYISALRSFRRRVAYANARFDNLVGWSTSSLRRRSELPKRTKLSRHNKYPHIVNIERAETTSTQNDISVAIDLHGDKSVDMEATAEAMIRGLTRVSWERIDVKFNGSKQRFLAHNTIQVKTKCLYSDGVDVIQHMVDNFLL